MPGADFFEYLSAFITIVLALALSDLIQSTHRLIRGRKRIRWDILPVLLAVYIYLTVLSEFFGMWDGLRHTNFSYLDLLGEMAVPTLVALAAFAVLPDDVPEGGLDLTAFYARERHYLISLVALIFVGDTIRNLLWLWRHDYIGHWQVWAWFSSLGAGYAAVLLLMWKASSRRLQLAGLIGLNLLAAVGYFVWSIKVDP